MKQRKIVTGWITMGMGENNMAGEIRQGEMIKEG
jgi:hypothetical protein